jgi:uncharacterized protein
MRHEGEPSVEEILESIKKVIARDNREAQQVERSRRESVGVAVPTARPVEEDEDEGGEVLDLADALIDREPRGGDGLTTESAARSMRDSLAALAMIAEPGAPPQIVRSGETSLEGLVREMLRPMLAEWLDRNLPEMVERLVKAEIARIAGKKG